MKYTRQRRDHADEVQGQDARKGSGSQVDPAEVAALLEDISCCIADAEVEAAAVESKDDEQLAAEAFDGLIGQYHSGEISRDKMKERGTVLKARFAHTQYIQRERCCGCGCPWND